VGFDLTVKSAGKISFVGGLRSWSGMNYTYPVIRLTISEAGIEISWRFWFPGLRPIAARWADIGGAARVRPLLPIGSGVQLDFPKGRVVFWCSDGNSRTILAACEEHGVPIDGVARWML
jgi:hypothetical protein